MIETLRRRADLLDAYRWVRGEWPVSRLGLDYCDLSCGLIVGADVCIDDTETLPPELHHRHERSHALCSHALVLFRYFAW